MVDITFLAQYHVHLPRSGSFTRVLHGQTVATQEEYDLRRFCINIYIMVSFNKR